MYAIWNIEFVKICIGRGRNKFENLCPIPLKKDSIKYVQTKPNQAIWEFLTYISPVTFSHGRRLISWSRWDSSWRRLATSVSLMIPARISASFRLRRGFSEFAVSVFCFTFSQGIWLHLFFHSSEEKENNKKKIDQDFLQLQNVYICFAKFLTRSV